MPATTASKCDRSVAPLYAKQTDPQIASRFEPFELPRWRESADLGSFVVSFDRLLPLKPSPFGDGEIIQRLMACSSSLTGKITSLLAQAAQLAIRRKTETARRSRCLGHLQTARRTRR